MKNSLSVLFSAVILFSGIPVVRTNAEFSAPQTLQELKNTPIEEIAALPRYDSRDYGIVPAIRDQGSSNLCWIYAVVSCAEISVLRNEADPSLTAQNIDFDEVELAKQFQGKWDDPLDLIDADNSAADRENIPESVWDMGGGPYWLGYFLAQWQGLVLHDEVSPLQEGYSRFRQRGFASCSNRVSEIKKLVAEYGAAAFRYYPTDKTYYAAFSPLPLHASAIIGWDDSVPASMFEDERVTTDGAWIVRNSYGRAYHDNGVFYLSYASTGISDIIAFDIMSQSEYDYNYQYCGAKPTFLMIDFTGESFRDYGEGKSVAVYQALMGGNGAAESLKGVCLGVIGKNVEAKVSVYSDLDPSRLVFGEEGFSPLQGTPAATASAVFSTTGMQTLPVDPVPLIPGSYFAICVELSSGSIMTKWNSWSSGDMVYYTDRFEDGTTGWKDYRSIFESTPMIRGFTVLEPIDTQALSKIISALREIRKGLSEEGFSAEDFLPLSQAYAAISSLSEGEIASLSQEDRELIQSFREIFRAWDLLRDADGARELAQKVFEKPTEGLFSSLKKDRGGER